MTPLLLFSLLLGLNLCPHVFSAVSGGGDNGAECLPDAICNDLNAICGQTFTCSCKQGYSDVEGLCRKIEGVLGRPCNGTADCFDRNSICFQSTCQCAQGFSPEGQICISSDGSPPPPPPTTETPPPTAPPTPPTALPPNSTAPPLPSTTFSEEQTPPIGPPPTETPPPTAPRTPPTALLPNATAPPPPSTTFSEEQTPPIGPPPTESPPPPNATAPPTVPATAPPTPVPTTNYTEEQTPPIAPPTAPPTETPPPTPPPTEASSTAPPPTVPPQTDLPPTEAPLTTAYPHTQTGTTYSTTDASTTSYECVPECANFGSCVTDGATGADKCLCPLEFTGLYCETPVDVCFNNKCPPESTCKPDTTSTNGHICVCVGDFTGQDCSKVDPLVTCHDIDKILHLDIKPVPDDRRRICFPKRDTTTTNICYDETENLIYKTENIDDTRLQVDDLRESYCISYIADTATEPRYCTQVTAYEGDDFSIRPWRHANATLCFLFNRKPNLTAPFEVRYNIPNMTASETLQLSARDPDTHQTITFQILGTEPEGFFDLFSMDATGLLETKKPTFDLPDPFDIDLKLRLKDNGIPVLITDRVFKVKFTNRELFCTSKEDPIYVHTDIAEFPLEIGQINCQTDNPTLSFSVPGDSDLAGYFKVEQDGAIFLNPGLLEGTYDLTVKAEVTQPVRIVTNVPITIILGNMIPDCSVVLDTFSMPEDEVIGSCSEITKTCSNPSGKLVQCADDSDLFNVRCTTLNDNSIEMKFCSVASLRNMVGPETITTIISNTFGDASVKQEAIVENVNDRPVLVKLPYNFTIDETYTIGELVTSIIVTDPDQFVSIQPPESLTVEITAPPNNPAGEDRVYPFEALLSDAGDKVEVTVFQLLDADTVASQRYSFLVKVTDSGGLSDSVLVTVHVADVNDESPICDPQQYDKTVSVKDQPGKIVATLECTDRDLSPEFHTLSYSLDGDLTIITEHFAVDSNRGVVQLTKTLADVTTSSLSFAITVSDGAGLSSQVKVNIDISSDYPPECDAAVLTTRKSENMENTCFTIPSKCTEPVDSLPLRYEIDTTGNWGNGTQYFRLDVKEILDDMIGICTIGSLKNRYGTWVLYVRAISDFGSTPITIHISVSDQNDPPEFVNAPYSVSVQENALVGTELVTLSARDPDSGAFGQVTFISEGELGLSASQMFKLDGTTGIIRVQGNLDADISTSTVYTFIVKAIDEGPAHDPPVTTNVTISIIDVNDNAPECDTPTSADPINLLTPPGTHVYNLTCTDNDKSPQFRQLSYEIIRQSTPDVFSISRDGSIVLESLLSRDITKYSLAIAVHDSSDNQNRNTQTVDIVLNVNTEVPPECSPATISQTVSERKPVNFCIQEVRCIDKTGGGQLELISTTGDGMDYLEIKIRKEEQQLLLSACIKESLEGRFGTYQIKGNVSNGLAEVNVLWNITVKNENDYPSFGKQLFEETIPEDSDPGLILKLDLSDPDDSTSEERFHIVNVTAVSQNDHNNASAVSNSISFFSEVRSFYLSVPNLNATLRNEYRYKVTAVDGGGLKASTTAVIYISDVNESPICEPTEVASSITILAEVGDQVASLSCFDIDHDSRNRELQYSIASGDIDSYFSVSTDGTITVAKKLPRTNLYNTGTANLEVIVEDRGIPILSTSVNVQITVDNSIPPECNPVLTPPDKWLQGACLTITMNCVDPSLPDSPSLLSYDPSGNYSGGFNISDPLRDAFRLCYRLIDDGIFQIKVRVDNGLSVYQYSEVIIVKYEEATPVFTNSSFRAVVPEFTTANTEILRARATSSNQIGDLVYSIIGAESDDGWSVYFEIDTNTGMITSLKTLRDLADTKMRLKVEVKDTGSKLKSSAQVEITIEDINEPPVCDLQPGDVNLDVDTDIGHTIMQFKCTDPDIVPANKQLLYTLKGQPNVQVYFKLMPDNDPTSIVLQELLPVYITAYDDTRGNSKGSYQVDFEVSDSGQPPLIYSVQFNIIVSLLPPAVVLKISELSYSHVFVTWEYLREEYNQITDYFQVKIREPGGDFVTTDRLTSGANSYNVTDIKSETEFELFVSAETPYGTRNSEPSTVTTLAIPEISRITVAVKYQELEFSSLLRNPNSQYYRATTTRVRASVDFPLKGTPGYAGNSVFQYSPGSVIAVIFLSVNQSGNTSTTRDLLAQSVKSGYLGELAVDSTYFYANVGGGLVIVETLAIRNENVYNGTDISIACAISTMGYDSSAEFIFWWTFNDIRIRPTIVSRLSTSSFTNTTFPELYTSVLNIEAVTPRDTGLYRCYAADAEEQSSSSKTINMEVLSQPIVSLTPRSLTANSGDTVTVTCTLTGPLDLPAEFVWYRNDSLLESKEGEVYSSNETAGTITIASMTVTTIFGCRGRNEAGLGPLVQSYIGVIPRGPEIELCPEITDDRGTIWPASLPGASAVKKCPPGYTGSIKRICDGNSRWKPPKYNCVQDKITEIQKEINSVKDGSSRGQIRKSLEGLNNATDTEELYEGDIRTCIDTLDDTAVASESTGQGSDDVALQIEEIDNYLKVCSNLIGEINKQSWESSIENDGYGAIEVSRVVEKYIKTKSEQLSAKINEPFERDFNQQNIYAKISRETGKSLTFPDRGGSVPAWVENSGSQIYIPEESLGGLTGDIISNGAYLRNLSSIVTMPLKRNGIIEDASKSYAFNTEIIYYKVQGLTGKVDPPLTVSFKPFDVNFSRPICVYWDFAENAWSEDGCYLADFSSSLITCKCNHLTNFAVLMSPGPAPEADILALSIISAVGCAISLFCLVITIVLHGMLWRIVKSDRAVLLLNLCVALIIGYAVFLGGVGQADNKDLCTAIAVLLHYIFLAVFFLMLAEGVEIAVSIMYVFATKSRVKFLVPLAWFIPAVIVGISAGVTKLEGYGNETFCWLSTESGLFWAFVGPAAFVILVNFIIIVIVFRQMFTSSAMLTKSDKQKAKTSLRSICVLLPIMGLTWVFGVFSVNESLVAFQYIFAICNSLQGFFIFLFHCLLNKQLQDALKQRRARKKSLQSFEKSFKNQHSTGTSSTAYPSLDDKSKQFNNEQSMVPSSNPFLEADRQMKEMVGKGKKTGNTFDRDANNKKEKIDKDKPPVDVALEDVKISNILRESEVMGGTTGISSILTNSQTDTDVHTAKEELPVDDNSKMRASKASTHGYDYILDSSYRTSAGIEKPAGYEKLLGPATKSTRYDRIVRSDETVSGYYDYAKDTGSGSQGRTESKQREDSRGRSSTGRSDNDYEQRLREGQDRIQTVYMPYDPSTQSSQEEVGASMPKKYDPKQTKRVTEIQIPKKGIVASNKPKVAESGAVKKLSSKKKKEMERSKIYQYPYDQTYLGPQSRHSSLENMTVHYVNPEYSPYAGMQPQGYTGRPTHQPRQWNPYGWGNQQRRDYW